MKHFSHLNTALALLESYRGDQPFHQFTRQYFSLHKKYGSKDRKIITQLCYGYFRAGIFLHAASAEDQLLAGLFLTTSHPPELLSALKPEWGARSAEPLAEKCRMAGAGFPLFPGFPAMDRISPAIDKTTFIPAHLAQPAVFLRVRPGHRETVIGKLRAQGIGFSQPFDDAIRLDGQVKVEQLLELNREVVIQDLSSQRTGSLLPEFGGEKIAIYDCCAGGGGKSILLRDRYPAARLTLTDTRKSMVEEVNTRFRQAGITRYRAMKGNAANPAALAPGSFDLVLADVPCSGSGTWGRTPERLSQFKPTELEGLVSLQQKIVAGVRPLVKKGGWLLYITCSVYEPENEAMAAYISRMPGLVLSRMELIKGYTEAADTMFAALFRSE